MKRILLLAGYLLGPWVAACVPPSIPAGSTPYYVSRPTRTFRSQETSIAVVFIDERTLIWMNAIELNSRMAGYERGGCARIAKQVGDAFYVDSILEPLGDVILTRTSAKFGCRRDHVPIHWHPIIDSAMCEVGGADVTAEKSVFPFVMMVCGLGIDSVYAYKIKPTSAVAGR